MNTHMMTKQPHLSSSDPTQNKPVNERDTHQCLPNISTQCVHFHVSLQMSWLHITILALHWHPLPVVLPAKTLSSVTILPASAMPKVIVLPE
mmetsp:Transcript_17367/g.29749  ORF Transcript_17367/g.29749 Transcript_17367/m.29749 type:complete len:92 (-) Transcript_17367:686-961(-)